ncbi:F-box/kelch-repeat protein At3g06240-like [Papaver somniferum]|uniref:F-box/kelch-repeat protein At3g06240-like n=1 Tax=Papaver somniferum TaxID=3469 RepID=UPI000E6FFDD6|nr:F-box/kelch-repeat protein At3g06240-like [Papaver somniferum]
MAGSFTVQVYTLGSDSWKSIQLSPISCSILWSTPGLFFNGALHWSASKSTSEDIVVPSIFYPSGKKKEVVIISFDISNYRLVEVPVSEEIRPLPSQNTVGVLNDCFCLVTVDDFWVPTDIWVMQEYGVRESWTKRFSITRSRLESTHLIYFRKLPFKNGILMYDGIRIVLLDNST